MSFGDAIRIALGVVWSQKMKSIFSAVGVFVGVTFLIAVVSIIEGMNHYMTDKFAGALLGVNTFQLSRRPNFQVGNVSDSTWHAWARRPRITYDDARAVVSGIHVPIMWAWESQTSSDIQYRGKTAARVRVLGVTDQYFALKGWNFAMGRPFTAQENETGQPVVVMGYDLAQKIFGKQDPINRTIQIRGLPYRIIGVIESQGNIFGMSLDNFVAAPALSPVKRFVNRPHVLDALLVKGTSITDMQAAMDQAEAVMRTRRHLRPTQADNFTLETASGVLDFWSKINQILIIALPGLVSISLVVGGIVIMNIMLMAVAERTREIGIRKALGARRRDILRQFLVESATLATVGASLGVGTGLGVAWIVTSTTFLPARVAPWSIVVGVVLGAGVGITAGLYPASRASRLDPIAAMRHE
ncbi:MAG TPA: ABC transporter permease [Gemmatimonadales bacterium]|nr:ABC transporter permease [Gemmatimonadales bacterium]